MWAALALAFALAMDATAIAAARGLAGHGRREYAILPLVFGGFQAGMAALGWLAGRTVGDLISEWDHWVAFGVLLVLGAKMIWDGWKAEHGEQPAGTVAVYLALAIATSIDAAAAGITLPLVPVAPWLALLLIGAVTAACAAAGFALGRSLGRRVGPRLGIVGGVALVAIGVHMLLR